MIYLEQGQKVLDRPELVVYEPTGERNDIDMVICAEAKNPSEPFCWLEAQYIAYGGLVYKISDDKELEAEILKIDPDSTINDVATEPVVAPENFSEQVNSPADHSVNTSVPEVQVDEPTSFTPVEPVAPSVPEIGTPISETSTSTSPITSPVESVSVEPTVTPNVDNVSTSTWPIVEPIIETIIEPAANIAPVESVADPIVSFIKRKIKKNLS
jgi:hypothetical protein